MLNHSIETLDKMENRKLVEGSKVEFLDNTKIKDLYASLVKKYKL